MTLDPELLAEALGSRKPHCWEPVNPRGYTRSRAWRVQDADRVVFAKQAEDEGSLHMLRTEASVYRSVHAPYLPAFAGFADSGERALLAIEFIEEAHWPPPYPADVRPLFDALDAVAATPPPATLPRQHTHQPRWEHVAADPEPLLGLGLCTRAWLAASIDRLLAAEREADFEGDTLVHNDIYSANVCFTPRGAVLVDWGAAVRGSRWIDVALALLSIRVEGGAPRETPPQVAPFAAAFAGHFAIEAPAPLPDWAELGSTLREDMKGDLAHALHWCVELLELPSLS